MSKPKLIEADAPYVGSDIYCDEIIPGKRPSDIVIETEHVLAFHHARPNWPVHIVVVPKQHISSLLDISDHPEILAEATRVIAQVSKQMVDRHEAATVTTDIGRVQESKHLHWHVHCGAPFSAKV